MSDGDTAKDLAVPSEDKTGGRLRGRLGRNDTLVLRVLRDTNQPMTAYEVMEHLRPEGVRSPPTVYRALSRLMREGHVHKIESLNAFVPCRHEGHAPGTAVMALCRVCGAAEEFCDAKLASHLADQASKRSFRIEHVALELTGLCQDCYAVDAEPA